MRYNDDIDIPELRRQVSAMNQRARNMGAVGTVTIDLLRDCIYRSGGQCEWCGTSILHSEFEVDHIISLVTSGLNAAANLAIACPDCNRRKSARNPAHFIAELVSRHDAHTPLIERLVSEYNIRPAYQPGLFDAVEPHPPGDTMPDDDDPASTGVRADSDDVPPYRWSPPTAS